MVVFVWLYGCMVVWLYGCMVLLSVLGCVVVLSVLQWTTCITMLHYLVTTLSLPCHYLVTTCTTSLLPVQTSSPDIGEKQDDHFGNSGLIFIFYLFYELYTK